jgi:hypothetical protein
LLSAVTIDTFRSPPLFTIEHHPEAAGVLVVERWILARLHQALRQCRPANQVVSLEREGAPCVRLKLECVTCGATALASTQGANMDITTLLIIAVVIILLGGGGWYGRGRWY